MLAAAAKINLNLLVGRRRDDGFHEIDSLAARITLYDHVRLSARDDGRIGFTCTGADCGSDEDNLALLAARLLSQIAPERGADVLLAKGIPPGSGLGGASADAAAVLAGLCELWGANVSAGQLFELALRLGSDVPFFLGPPAARMTGRGDLIEPVNVHPFWAVLYLGGPACPTTAVYRAFDQLSRSPCEQVDPASLAQPPSRWRGVMRNQLLPAARGVSGELGRALDRLSESLPAPVCMTGSGGALFVLCDDLAEARAVLHRVPADMRGGCCIVRSNVW